MSDHARFSPSGSVKWLNCAGSLVLEAQVPDTSSTYADEGTAAHFLLSTVLQRPEDTAQMYRGEVVMLLRDEAGRHWQEFAGKHHTSAAVTCYAKFVVNDDMAEAVQKAVTDVRECVERHKLAGAVSVNLMVEQRVEFSRHIGVPDQFGTADVLLAIEWPDGTFWISVQDYKHGRGVEVDAEENSQLMLYALGCYDALDMIGEITTVELVIHQPRLHNLSIWECSKATLFAFAEEGKRAAHLVKAAEHCMEGTGEGFAEKYLVAGDHCKKGFCKAFASCPATAAKVQADVGADFEVINSMHSDAIAEEQVALELEPRLLPAVNLSAAMSAIDFIEGWCKAVRAETERRLLAGEPVVDYKLVEGRAGARAWTDEAEATKVLREQFRLPVEKAFDLKLISPTSAEKLHKAGEIGPKQWPKLQPLIGRSSPKPSVAHISDKRPAMTVQPVADEFIDETAGGLV